MNDNRRDAIADAAIEIIASEGLRALTHRAIDGRLDYPAGSTSYYVRTRQALIEAVVARLSSRTFEELSGDAAAPPAADVGAASALLAGLVVSMANTRPHDHLARYALRIDLIHEPELHTLISDQSPVRARLLAAGIAILTAIGVAEAKTHAHDLVGLVDDLIFDRLTNSKAAADPHRVMTAYLSGLVAAG